MKICSAPNLFFGIFLLLPRLSSLSQTRSENAGQVILKSHGERIFRNPNAQAGYMKDLQSTLRQSRITIMERTDLPGNDYEELSDVGFGQCSDRCESDSRCEAFTYMAKRKRCWLKDSLWGPAPSKLTKSSVKGQ